MKSEEQQRHDDAVVAKAFRFVAFVFAVAPFVVPWAVDAAGGPLMNYWQGALAGLAIMLVRR